MRRVIETNANATANAGVADYPSGVAEETVQWGFEIVRVVLGTTAAGRFRVTRNRDGSWAEAGSEDELLVVEEGPPRFDARPVDVGTAQGLTVPTWP